MSSDLSSKERVLPKTDLEWIAHTLSDAEAAIKVLSTMLAKEGLKMGFAVADEILGNVRSAQKNCSHLIERERRTAAEPPADPWEVFFAPKTNERGVLTDTHRLTVSGPFGSQDEKRIYCERLAAQLNRAAVPPGDGCAKCSNVAPIANIRVGEDDTCEVVHLYAPGLPPGEHDLYPAASTPDREQTITSLCDRIERIFCIAIDQKLTHVERIKQIQEWSAGFMQPPSETKSEPATWMPPCPVCKRPECRRTLEECTAGETSNAPKVREFESASKAWAEYPIGTVAKQSWTGCQWTKTERGWKAGAGGSTFPIPGGADQVLLPESV